ncbi:hypothetical protein M9H77_06546 [Catharanthus roseus]|uniref:Uncharacterized protein n=1 Tax=Catharanthus roseus TaxID=4058 RepID=A0ACC0BSN4_CATRO|nr:hypothetical protein M9H77_06546 [Catharanthus roseus]
MLQGKNHGKFIRCKRQHHENKVIIIIGATGTGKSRLSINLASHFPSEIINSEKIQVYKGIDIVGDKVPTSERGVGRATGVPEMHEYFLSEAKLHKTSKDSLLASSIGKIKKNTCALTRSQVWKILRLRDEI